MIFSFLSSFTNEGGKYVSWKNNHELHLVLNGESDLDIFIPIAYKSLFFELAQKQGWISVENPVASFPEIYHFYNIDKQLRVYHLHVYFKVITGESWLKEYEFPLDDFLIENSVLHSLGIYILNEKAQSFLFAIRHFIKGSSFFSRLLYKKELSSYEQEWNLCKSGFDPKAQPNFLDFSSFVNNSGLQKSFKLPKATQAKQVRAILKPYLRHSESLLPIMRFKSLMTRVLNKFFYKRKKVLAGRGFILVFSGADGVGKSTMSESIGKTYKSFLTVKNVQLGRPQSFLVEFVRKLLNKQVKHTVSSVGKGVSNKKVSLKKALSAVYLAYLRYATAIKAAKFRDKKYLIISDRWPTLEYFKMDGPKLEEHGLSGIYKWLGRIEKYYYEKLAIADLSIILTVPVEVAVQRNRDRIKKDKETDEEIKERHLQNANHNPKSIEIIRFDNNGDLVEKRYELIQLIQARLFRKE